jgi:hypothetical protein
MSSFRTWAVPCSRACRTKGDVDLRTLAGRIGTTAPGAARPEGPIAGRDGRADRGRDQNRYRPGLALVPHRDQVVGILKSLLLGRATCRGPSVGFGLAVSFHLVAIQSYGRIVAGFWDRSAARDGARLLRLTMLSL